MSEYKRLTRTDDFVGFCENVSCPHKYIEEIGCSIQDCDNCYYNLIYKRLAELEDKRENGQLVELPRGWLETLKLLTSAAVCYAHIKDLITSRMSQSKDIAELFFDCPTVQGIVLDFALSELSEAKIDFNNITGFEELLNTMPHFKEIAERTELARLKELQEGK